MLPAGNIRSAFGALFQGMKIWSRQAHHLMNGTFSRGVRAKYEGQSNTGLVRGLGRRLRESGTRLYCVWTRNRLKSDFDIDHCFPFAAWPCNDLWNLLPSAPAVNRSKGDRLPAAEALERSRSWILEWWDLAYRRDLVIRNQFEDEARSALPAAVFGLEESVTPEDVFEGLMVQQMVLKRDQQLAVWRPSRP